VKSIVPEQYDYERFLREVQSLIQLTHPCVLWLHGWSPQTERHRAEIQTEYAQCGSLDIVLRGVREGARESFPFWNPTGESIIICGIVLGMRYVHRKGYFHRDLKPKNILVEGNGRARLGDFGAIVAKDEDQAVFSHRPTRYYAAPETFTTVSVITSAAEVFSFGLILFEILAGHPAFERSMDALPVQRAILDGKMPLIPEGCGILMRDLIRRCWSSTPELRPSFDDIFQMFRQANFNLVPGANGAEVRAYVNSVVLNEE
jgi:serine/threonine protein kinase